MHGAYSWSSHFIGMEMILHLACGCLHGFGNYGYACLRPFGFVCRGRYNSTNGLWQCLLMHCGRYVMAEEITKIHKEVNLCYLLIKITPSLFWWDLWTKRNVFDSLTFYISYNVSKLGKDLIKLTLVSRMIFFLYDPVYNIWYVFLETKKIINNWNLLIFQSLQNFKTLKCVCENCSIKHRFFH